MSVESSNTPDWLQELRSQWKDAIQEMPEENRRQFESPEVDMTARSPANATPDEPRSRLSLSFFKLTPEAPESAPTLGSVERNSDGLQQVHSAPHTRSSSFGDISHFDSSLSSPRRVSDILSVSNRPILRTTSMLFAGKPKVEKALQTLRAYQLECDANLVAARSEERRFRAFIQADLLLFNRWSNPVLIAMCRKYANLRLHQMALQQAYYGACMLVVKQAFGLARRCVDEGTPVDDSADFLKGPKHLLSRSSHVMFLRKHCTDTETEVSSAHKAYMSARKGCRPLTRSEWIRHMKQVLLELQPDPLVSGTPYCFLNDYLQRRFDALLTDDRIPEGRRFWQFYDSLGTESWVPQDVTVFIENFARDISVSIGRVDDLDKIMVLVSRLVFTRAARTILHRHTVEEDREKDRIFVENQRRLRHEPQEHFGVDPPFVGPDQNAYHKAIEALRELAFVVAPSDALYHLMRATRLMYMQAKEYSNDETALGADYLFPIFVWCTLHANVPKFVSLVTFVRTFANANETSSETGYYLTTLEAAVEHVCRLTQDRFAAHLLRDTES